MNICKKSDMFAREVYYRIDWRCRRYNLILTAIKVYDDFLSIFSLKENRIVKQFMQSENGSEEMMSCEIGFSDSYLC